MSETSSYVGPYARLRDMISSERSRPDMMAQGDYTQGYIEALNFVERIISELESEMIRDEEVRRW